VPSTVADGCTINSPLYAPSQVGTLAGLLRGAWVRCSPSGISSEPHDGVYVDPYGRWVLLEKRDGAFVPKLGLENKGFVDAVSEAQADFVGDIGWTTVALPTFNSNGGQWVSDETGNETIYARLR
jgi:hypothetical protein